MPIADLASIPNGSEIFIDSNIFVYGLSGRSAQCHALLQKVSLAEITAVTSYHVVGEVTHKLMLADSRQRGLCNRRQKIFRGPPASGADAHTLLDCRSPHPRHEYSVCTHRRSYHPYRSSGAGAKRLAQQQFLDRGLYDASGSDGHRVQ